MLPNIELKIIRDNLHKLNESGYFSSDLKNYTENIISIIDFVLSNIDSYHNEIIIRFTNYIWKIYKYLSGSTSKEIPYELEYSLRFAIKDWIESDKCIITVAFAHDRDFHLFNISIIKEIEILIEDLNSSYSDIPIYISFPRLYKNKPLYNIPLYHELGHFIDNYYQITKTSLLLYPENICSNNNDSERYHRAEFFADLFASCYVGISNANFLQEISGNNPASLTHPSTKDRFNLCNDFLSAKPNKIIYMFQDILEKRIGKKLEIKFSKPNIKKYFDDIKPYCIADEKELHGIYSEGWSYLKEAVKPTYKPFKGIKKDDIERIINDLVEKSIRNKSIKDRWKNATPDA